MADIQRAPRVFERHFDQGADRAAQEVARTEKRLAPKARSTYTNSVGIARLRNASYLVGPAVNYAPMVEEGTGPGGFPKPRVLADWIRVKRIQPNDPTMSEEDLAFVMARSIVRKGTPAQPVIAQTSEIMGPRVLQLFRTSVANAMREARLR